MQICLLLIFLSFRTQVVNSLFLLLSLFIFFCLFNIMKLCISFFLSTLICVCVTLKENSATVLSARCRSRCLAKEIQRYRNITTIPVCITQDCTACMKPCNQRKKEMMSCSFLCGSFVHVRSRLNICKESCKFLKHLQLEDGNSSCPTGLADRECVLMTPENVEVATTNQETQISWNGTWPSATVFVIMARQMKKGASPDVGASQGWAALKQTTLQSVQVLLQPLLWYQFKVAATNQYGTSQFSIPSEIIFANPTRPNPPRDFHVKSMNIVKGQAEIDVSWKKPDNIALPIHRYKLSWSMRLDLQLDKFTSLTVTDRRVKGNIHHYTIRELQPNKTYVLEIQVISRWAEGRLRSPRVTLTVRTPALAEDNIKKKIKKKFEMTKNSIVSPKKTANGDSAVLSKPTIPTTMQGTNSTKNSSTHQSQALTPKSIGRVSESPNLKAQKSIAGLISVPWLVLTDTVIALVVTILCYL